MKEMNQIVLAEALIGRKDELRQLRAAIHERKSRLVWGPADSGKTALIAAAIAELPETVQRSCIYWTGAATGRQLLSHFVGRLYESGDPFVTSKVQADGATQASLHRWVQNQSSLRLRGILFTAFAQGNYRLFLDRFPPATHNMARLMKDLMYRCKTPVYLAARGCWKEDAGYAWSLYWNDGLRLRLGPLSERAARNLLEACIQRFSLPSLDLDDFRDEILRLSGNLPGAIVKMCELAANSRYHCGDHIKMKLLRVDYLMQSNQQAIAHLTNSLP
ncbi:MAG TPA: hypothetical protein VLY23_13620 [Candidatus Acidoferrum sp.]|nr:hypothetical protein [Candidatus Acidoferrum sp.]